MNDEMELEDGVLRKLVVAAVLVGLATAFVAEDQLLISVMTILGGEFHPYGVYLMELDTGSCEFHTPGEQLPAGYEALLREAGRQCAKPFETFVLERQIDIINQSTDSAQVEEIIRKAEKRLEAGEIGAARVLLERVKVERNYTVPG